MESPVVDGLLSEWTSVPAFVSAHRVYSAAGWDSSEDLTAIWRLAWDDENLYIAAEVGDDVHVQTQTGNQIYRGDSLEMQIDIGRARNVNATKLNSDSFQLVLSPGDFAGLPPSAFRFRGNNVGQMRDDPGYNIVVAAQHTATGYSLEAAIPWTDLFVTPRLGLVLGATFNANDNDVSGTAVQEVMLSNVPTRTFSDPSSWGTLTLQPAEAAVPPPIFERRLYLTSPYMRGDDVRTVQQRLMALGYTQVGEIDGVWGPLTEGAVKAFQSDRGLVVDGIVGPLTWTELFEAGE
jgi:hypothetical protein